VAGCAFGDGLKEDGNGCAGRAGGGVENDESDSVEPGGEKAETAGAEALVGNAAYFVK